MSLGMSKLTTCFTLGMSRPTVSNLKEVDWNLRQTDTHTQAPSLSLTPTHSSGHQNRGPSRPEAVEGGLTVTLGTVSVNAGAVIALGIEEVIQSITALLGLNEHQ